MTEYGANDHLLRHVGQATGGRYNAPLDIIFDSDGSAIPATAGAMALPAGSGRSAESAELVLRKCSGLREILTPRRHRGGGRQ